MLRPQNKRLVLVDRDENLLAMHVVTCLKQIIDPELPPSEFKLDPSRHRAAQGAASLVISIFDENALEVALQLRERQGEGRITALSLGGLSAVDALRKALSLRVDEAILLREEDFPALDSFGTARVLAAAVRKLEPVNLVLCGRETGDWHGGLVGAFLATELDRPLVSFVASIDQQGDKLSCRRQSDEGWEMVEAAIPAVATITNDGTNLPRIPKVKDNMMAFRKTIPVWTAADLGLDPARVCGPNAGLESLPLSLPEVNRRCEIITGQNSEEAAKQLVSRLAAMHLI